MLGVLCVPPRFMKSSKHMALFLPKHLAGKGQNGLIPAVMESNTVFAETTLMIVWQKNAWQFEKE